MEWDPFQREVLAAMGHTLLVPVVPSASAPADAALAVAPAPVPAPAVVTPRAAPAPPPAPMAATGTPDALRQALARAAGVTVDALPPDLPLAGLRGNAAAKRALWPRLRTLRGARR